MAPDDHELARLLSGRTGPSVLEKEAIGERVLAKTAQRRRRVLRIAWALPALAAAALIAIALRPGGEPLREFTARGAARHEPVLRVICVETGAVGACPAGGTLAFELDASRHRYAGLFARRSDGLVIWYFPSGSGESLAIGGTASALGQAIRLGENQPPGQYEIVGVLSDAPLTRTQIKVQLERGVRPDDDISVVRKVFTVEARR